jgi:hypothetical protein
MYQVTELRPRRKAVGCKWANSSKRDGKGNILELKARLVATGFS